MTSDDREVTIESLKTEIEAVLACLAHSRALLSKEKDESMKDLRLRIERCAERIANLSPDHRRKMQPQLLATLDDVEQTIEIFQKALALRRGELTSAYQGRAAGAAYRQAQKF